MRACCLVIAVTACGRFGFDADPPPPDAQVTFRSQLVLDRITPTEDLVDFPLLVVLDATRFDRSVARADLADLRFSTDDGTVLDHEFEPSADPDQVLAWVRVPLIASGTNPTLSLTYGDPDATPRTGAVWSASFAGVWHLDDKVDASANGNDGVGVAASHVAGRIGRGVEFAAGSSGHIAIADHPSLHGTAITASGWIRQRSFQQQSSALLARQREVPGIQNDFFLGINSEAAHGQMTLVGQASSLLNAPTLVPLDTWAHIALVFDGTAIVLYLDGVEVRRLTTTGVMASVAKPLYIGADANTGGANPDNDFVDGVIDEVRLQTVARTAAWIAADHASAIDGWITYGAIERL